MISWISGGITREPVPPQPTSTISWNSKPN
ncbi:hypothetical protein VPHD148_0308 [Vibrio phage D148]